jgi:hypothetical protein
VASRSQKFIDGLAKWLWPSLKFIFRIDIMGQENLPTSGAIVVANHNSGALIESHSLVFLFNERGIPALGLNHRALFKIPFVGGYFEKIGAIPATREATTEALKKDFPVLIFPGGNREAFRPLSEESKQGQNWSSGWSELAEAQQVPVVVVKFSGSHRINPIFFCSEILSKILILPWLLKVKYFPLSLAQILISSTVFALLNSVGFSPLGTTFFVYLAFVLTPLVPVLPWGVKIRIYPPLQPEKDFRTSSELKQTVQDLMSKADIPSGKKKPYSLNGIEWFMLYNETQAVSYNSQIVFDFSGHLDKKRILGTTEQWIQQIPYLRTAHSKGWLRPQRDSYEKAWFGASEIVSFEAFKTQKRMDDFCQRKFNLGFEPGVRFLIQSEGLNHRLIFSCHHSLFDGAAQVFVFEAWARLYNGREIPSGYSELRGFHFRDAVKKQGIFKAVKEVGKNLTMKIPRDTQGVATLADQPDLGFRRVTSRTIKLPSSFDSRARKGFDPVQGIVGAIDLVLRAGGDTKTPLFILFPIGLRWALKIRDSLQNAVVSVNIFLPREKLAAPGWAEKVKSRLAADPIASNKRFILGALAASSIFPEQKMRAQLGAYDSPGSPISATLLFVQAPIPRTLPLPTDWDQVSISARGTLLRSPSVGVVLTGIRGSETLTIEWVESLVSPKRIDQLENAIRQQLEFFDTHTEKQKAMDSIQHQ